VAAPSQPADSSWNSWCRPPEHFLDDQIIPSEPTVRGSLRPIQDVLDGRVRVLRVFENVLVPRKLVSLRGWLQRFQCIGAGQFARCSRTSMYI
jgi:hypothetical protein